MKSRADTIRERVSEHGFPRAAAQIDGTAGGYRLARREVERFQPCSVGEAHARGRALSAIPECEGWEDEDYVE